MSRSAMRCRFCGRKMLRADGRDGRGLAEATEIAPRRHLLVCECGGDEVEWLEPEARRA